MKIKKLCCVSGVLVLALILQACGKESTGSETERQYDRDRENSDVVAKNDDAINGTFSGVVNNADIVLVIKTTKVTVAGSLVPEPTLVGTLVFSPRVAVGDSDERVKDYFPYEDGAYDKASGVLSFTLEKDARPTRVKCTVNADFVHIDCSWDRRANEVKFSVGKTSDDALDKLDSDNSSLFGGDYVGHTDKGLLVRGSFNSGLVNKADSGIPQLSVIGSFTFYSESQKTPDIDAPQAVYPFTDGTYDVSTGTISATTTADNGSSIVANCKVKSSDVLDCSWYSREFTKFVIYRESLKPKHKRRT